MSSPERTTPDAYLAAAIARAEKRRAMLERLAEIGMELAEQVGAHAAASAAECGPRCDPARAFAGVSRAVRFTLHLAARVDKQILAMRKGAGSWASEPSPRAACERAASGAMRAESPAPRGRVRDAVLSAINTEVEDLATAERALNALHERLVESEDYDRFLFRPFRETVAAICDDLGLAPDWSRWSEETGFAEDPQNPRVRWNLYWKYDPEHAEHRRHGRAERRSADVSSASAFPKKSDGPSALRPMSEARGRGPP